MNDFKVFIAATTGLTIPDVVNLFQAIDPIVGVLVRVGQVGVAIATIYYIFKKAKALKTTRKR